MNFYAVAMGAILVALAIAVFRVLAGPSLFDRVIAANYIGTLAMMFVAVLGFLNGRPEFLDVALVYAFLNLTGTFAVLKFFRYGELGRETPAEEIEKLARSKANAGAK